MKKYRWILLFVFSSLVLPLGAQEYWADYLHSTDAHNFDAPAMMFGSLDKSQVENRASYTALYRDDAGHIIEALSFLNGEANYYWTYYYDDADRLLLRTMSAFMPDGEIPLSKLQLNYSDNDQYSAAYYNHNPFSQKWTLKYLKEYNRSNYRLFDYTPEEPDPQILRRMDETNRHLEELERLESRGLLKKIFGIR